MKLNYWNVKKVRGISVTLMCGIFLAFLQIQKPKYSQLLHEIVPPKTVVYHFFKVTDEFFGMIEIAIALVKQQL